jgi:azurin
LHTQLQYQCSTSTIVQMQLPVRLRRFAQRRRILAAALGLPAIYVSAALEARAAQVEKEVDLSIASDGDLLTFKPDRLTCRAGAPVRLTFYNTAKYVSQEHNWVLVEPGTAAAVEKAAEAAGEANGFVPRGDPRVLAATPMCGKGQHVSIEFIAPTAPGNYPFLCTNPGHGAVMHGVLVVTPGLTSN